MISGNCNPGFAPFCGTRSASCPQMGWVSCNGDCSCVAIPGYDGGVSDASVGPDASGADVVAADAPGADAQSMDVQSSPMDVQSSPMDAQPGTYVQVFDTPAPRDVTVSCPTGVVVDGVCYTEHCQYDMEIGFYCGNGLRCLTQTSMGFCVPVCAGVTCTNGEHCDPTFGCTTGTANCGTTMCPAGQFCDTARGCTTDLCSAIDCPAGSTCQHNLCVAPRAADGGTLDGAPGDGGTTPQTGGCGCRTAGDTSSRGAPALALAGLGLAALARRGRRRRDRK